MSRPRSLVIRIDRIVVDAAAVRGHEAPVVHAAIETELARLLAPPIAPISGGAVRAVSLSNPGVGAASTPERVGQEIARSIHALVTGVR